MSEISQFSQGLHEECGVFGMYDKTGATDMVSAVYSALYALQHRGQESCGIALNVDGVLSGHRDLGLVSEVFTKRVLEDLPRGAKMATGHVRYATAGQRSRSNAQPMILHHCKGAMAVCHNGNLVNAPKLRRKLEMSGSIFHGTSDTEVIAYLLTQNRLLTPNIEMAVSRTMDDIEGAYSLVIMTHTKLIAARDPNGFRPLCIGELPDGSGWAFASESCALDAVGAKFVRDVKPGEIVIADRDANALADRLSSERVMRLRALVTPKHDFAVPVFERSTANVARCPAKGQDPIARAAENLGVGELTIRTVLARDGGQGKIKTMTYDEVRGLIFWTIIWIANAANVSRDEARAALDESGGDYEIALASLTGRLV